MKTTFKNKELEDRLDAILQNCTIETTIISEQGAEFNRPAITDNSIKPYFEPIHHLLQGGLNLIEQETQVNSILKEVHAKRKFTEDTVKQNEHLKSVTRKKEAELNSATVIQPSINKRQVLIYQIAVGSISLIEGAMSQIVFEESGSPYWLSWILAIVFAICIAIVAHSIPKIIIKFGDTPTKQKLIAIAIVLILFIVFYFMASIRVNSYQADTEHIGLDPLPFALTSTFFTTIAAWAVYLFAPSKKDLKILENYNLAIVEKKSVRQQIESYTNKSMMVKEEAVRFEQEKHSEFNYATSLEYKVIHHANYCFSLYKQINTLKRNDGKIPACFEDSTYPFEFKTHFINHIQKIGKVNHEN